MEILDAGSESRARRGIGRLEGPVAGPVVPGVPGVPVAGDADLVADLDTGGRRSPDPAERRDADRGDAERRDDAAPARQAEPGAVRAGPGTLVGSETLALAALVLEVTGLSGGLQTTWILSGAFVGDQTNLAMIGGHTRGLAFFAVPSAVLAVGALVRLRHDAPAWVRAVTGAAVIVGVLTWVLIGYSLWHAAGLDPQPPSMGTG